MLCVGVCKKIFTTLIADGVMKYELAEKCEGLLRTGLINSIKIKFSWFTAHDWLEFCTTAAVYVFNGEVTAEVLKIVRLLAEAVYLLLQRYPILIIYTED